MCDSRARDVQWYFHVLYFHLLLIYDFFTYRFPFRQALAAPRFTRSFRASTMTSMALKTGIVGLPNVGKSTMFNALVVRRCKLNTSA